MEILITGSNGFLGSYLKKYLGESNSVFGTSRSNSDYDFDLTQGIPNFAKKFDLVIHAAGLAHTIPKTELEAKKFESVNVQGTHNLLDALDKSYLPEKLVFISSVSVYGLINGIDISEKAPLNATDPYGTSKIICEQIIINWCENRNVRCTILRLPLIIGENAKGNFSSMVKSIQKGYYFQISGINPKKSMVSLEDIGIHIIKASEIGGIYNLTDGYHPDLSELSATIAKMANKSKIYQLPYWIVYIASVLGDLIGNGFPINTYKLNKLKASLTFNDAEARKNFGWNPKPVLERLNFLNINNKSN